MLDGENRPSRERYGDESSPAEPFYPLVTPWNERRWPEPPVEDERTYVHLSPTSRDKQIKFRTRCLEISTNIHVLATGRCVRINH
jgi:hypothetical protein